MAGLSAFLLFLDLAKAFDFIVRIFAIGPQQGTGDSINDAADAVAKLGLDQEEARQLASEIQQHGSYLEMCGADPKSCQAGSSAAHRFMVPDCGIIGSIGFFQRRPPGLQTWCHCVQFRACQSSGPSG